MATSLVDADLLERLERLSIVSRRRVVGFGKGDRRSVRRGTSLEFVDYRPYATGDDPRMVDWNIYRRSGHLYVKLYEEEEVLTVHLLLDVSRSMDWGEPSKLEYARRLVAALAYIGMTGSNRIFVSTLVGGVERVFGPAWGKAQMGPLLNFLDTAPASGETDLDEALRLYVGRVREPGLAMLVTDLMTPKFETGIRRLLDRRFEVVLLHIVAPQELQPSMTGDLTLIDRESGAEVPITLNQEALDRYRRRLNEWLAQIESFCGRHQVLYHRIPTDERLERVMFDALRKRGVLR
ncbi:MAG: DUF58 domain-containing protein [Chloroflexi bacterium]|nr:DUF58 domain-containing protein [Chloroflexota bacterium]